MTTRFSLLGTVLEKEIIIYVRKILHILNLVHEFQTSQET